MIKNVIFDFGDVIAHFCPRDMIASVAEKEEDQKVLETVLFKSGNWDKLDAGELDYSTFRQKSKELLPEGLHDMADKLFEEWYLYMPLMEGVPELIRELKDKGYHLYILSNASEFFAKKSDYFGVNQEFDGIVFSALVKMVKPNPEIYQYLLDTYDLNPEECLFLDDRPANIEGAKKLGIHGMVFTGDVDAVRRKLYGKG